jgi:hypothetical protein
MALTRGFAASVVVITGAPGGIGTTAALPASALWGVTAGTAAGTIAAVAHRHARQWRW